MTDTITLRRAEAERGRTALRLARKFVGPTLSDELSIFLAALDAALEAQEDEALLNEPVAMRYDGDGYGYLYIDSGSGSDWQRRHKDAEPLYLAPPQPDAKREPYTLAELFAQFAAKQRPLDADMAAIINANLDSLYITDEPAAALAEPTAKREPATEEVIEAKFEKSFYVHPEALDDFAEGWCEAERFHGIRKENQK
jgi:hypothetical protein